MMKYIVSLMVLLCLASSVSAFSLFSFALEDLYNVLMPMVTGLAILSLIIVLQYVGINVIGLTFSLITFTINTFFTIIAQVTSREESLISAVILFIIVMAVLLGML